jgi:hypothetical protein
MVALGDALCVNARGVPVGHARLNAEAEAVTLSLKLMTMLELKATLVEPPAGVVLLTLGAASPPPHGASGEAVFRGFGAPAVKSPELLSVSVQPLLFLRAAVVLVSTGVVGPAPSKQFVPVP